MRGFSPLLAAEPGGDTGAPETSINPIPREWYHTDWVADRTIAYLDSLPDDADWFVWMSFPDPHHPWDPPASERSRVDWRDLDLPPGHPGSPDKIAEVLAQKPAHWLACYEGTWVNREGGPGSYRPQSLSDDNIREINAMAHVMNEMIDEACGRVLQRGGPRLGRRHRRVLHDRPRRAAGRLRVRVQGPVPHRRADAAAARVAPGPVGRSDAGGGERAGGPRRPRADVLRDRRHRGAGLDARRLVADGRRFRSRTRDLRVGQPVPGYGMHLRTIYRDGWLCTAYEKSTIGEPNGLEPFLEIMHMNAQSSVEYDGSEGELYTVDEDPYQFRNLWDDPDYRSLRDELVADLYDNLPPAHEPRLLVERPGPSLLLFNFKLLKCTLLFFFFTKKVVFKKNTRAVGVPTRSRSFA